MDSKELSFSELSKIFFDLLNNEAIKLMLYWAEGYATLYLLNLHLCCFAKQSCWGPTTSVSKNVNKLAKHAAQKFIRQTLERCKKFEETDISCFQEPVFKDMFLAASSHSHHSQVTDFLPADVTAKPSNDIRSTNPSLEHPFSKEEIWSNRIKKKEVLIDYVVGNTSAPSSQAPTGLGTSLAGGGKGKRSERDRAGKNTTGKLGRSSASSCKEERKNRAKPKVKTTQQLSASVNVLHNMSGSAVRNDKEKENPNLLSVVKNDHIDLSNLQLPDMDAVDFGGQGQDIASWLNFEEEGMQDQDFMGLQIPMDDLSDVHMMV